MEHLRQFESFKENRNAEIDAILNIARDEGLAIYNPADALIEGWDENWYIERLNIEDPDAKQATISNQDFIELIKNIYNRLEQADLLIISTRGKRKGRPRSNRFQFTRGVYITGQKNLTNAIDITNIHLWDSKKRQGEIEYAEFDLYWTPPEGFDSPYN